MSTQSTIKKRKSADGRDSTEIQTTVWEGIRRWFGLVVVNMAPMVMTTNDIVAQFAYPLSEGVDTISSKSYPMINDTETTGSY